MLRRALPLLLAALAMIFLSVACTSTSPGAGNTPAPTYSVTYLGNGSTGGSVPVDANAYAQGQSVTVLGNTGSLVQSNFTFAGWQINGAGTVYTPGQTFSMGSANVTLEAKWTANPTYTVTYMGNNNTGGTVPVDLASYEQGQTVTVLGNTNNLVLAGAQFAGWNTQADGNGTTYASGATFPMGSASVILYAKWSTPTGGTFSAGGTMTTARAWAVANRLANGLALIAGGVEPSTQQTLATAELYDPSTQAFTATGGLTAARSGALAATLPNGQVLLAGGDITKNSAEIYDPAAGTFSASKALTLENRSSGTATALPGGKVLLAGGQNSSRTGAVATAELYDPATDTFTATGSMASSRMDFTATLLNDGTVLMVGGNDGTGTELVSAETYDPSTGQFSTLAAQLHVASEGHTATLLGDGTVLIAGGTTNDAASGVLARCEICDPVAQAFTLVTAGLATARSWQHALLLENGLVFLEGGLGAAGLGLASVELYDPSAKTFSAAPSMTTERFGDTATLMGDGTVLIAGGELNQGTLTIPALRPQARFSPMGGGSSTGTSSSTVYTPLYPAPSGFLPTGTMAYARSTPLLARLPNGTYLVAGGVTANAQGQTPAEIFNLGTGSFTTLTGMTAGRDPLVSTPLGDGRVLFISGQVANGGNAFYPSTSETFDPRTLTFTATAQQMAESRTQPALALLHDGTVLVAGGEDMVLAMYSGTHPFLSTAEIFYPGTGAFAQTPGSMTFYRGTAAAVTLYDGTVLVLGGELSRVDGKPVTAANLTADIYNPATGQFTESAGPLPTSFATPTLTLLSTGKVLVVSGSLDSWAAGYANSALYNPATRKFETAGSLLHNRWGHAATLLPNGKVMITGGYDQNGLVPTAELYDPGSNSFSSCGTLAYARAYPAAAMLWNGKVLVVGGAGSGNGSNPSATAEISQ